MPEKTLKESTFAKASVDEKVERANLDLAGIEIHYPHIDLFNIQEALTALEETLQRARDAIVKTQDELRLLSEAQDIMGRPQTAKQLMDIHDMLSAYTPEEK